jgi:hypothetical protein
VAELGDREESDSLTKALPMDRGTTQLPEHRESGGPTLGSARPDAAGRARGGLIGVHETHGRQGKAGKGRERQEGQGDIRVQKCVMAAPPHHIVHISQAHPNPRPKNFAARAASGNVRLRPSQVKSVATCRDADALVGARLRSRPARVAKAAQVYPSEAAHQD